MKSHNISKTQVNGEGIHPRVMLNKLHFDFRNAKPAFLGVSYCKLDDVGMKPDVEQTALSCNKSGGGVEQNRVSVLKCGIDASGAGADEDEINKTAHPKTVSAVHVDDHDSDRLAVVSDAASVQLPSCAADTIDESTDGNCALLSVGSEHAQSADELFPNSSLSENNILPPLDASSSSLMSSLVCQTNKRAGFSRRRQQYARQPTRTNSNIAENKTAVKSTESIAGKPFSIGVEKPYASKESADLALHSHSHDTLELSGSFGHSESSHHSSTSSVYLFQDVDDVPMRERKRKRGLRYTGHVKKSLRSKNAHNLDTLTAASVKVDAKKCKHNKLKVTRTPKRRQRTKSDSEDEVWSTQKKLLIMPVDKKLAKSGLGRKRNRQVKREMFALMPKRKGRRSVPVEGMELPDLGATLDAGSTDAPEMLNTYSWELDVDENTPSTNTSRKWYVDITGADLTTDLNVDSGQITENSDQQKSLVSDKPDEQNVAQHMPQYAMDAEGHHTISTSQETPPPSVTSDGFSSCDESDQSVRSNEQGKETWELSNNRWLYIGTKLASYIDGRRFDRLVNGISIQVPATTTDEALAHIGQEHLCLAQLTKRDVKELQDQVRLEEIYHRRARKSTQSVCTINSDKRVRRRTSRQHNLSHVVLRATAKFLAKYQRTVGDRIEIESAQADTVHQQGTSSVDDELHQSAVDSDDNTVPYLSSDDDAATKSKNVILESEGMCTSTESESLKCNAVAASHEAGPSGVYVDGAKQQEPASVSVLVRIRRSAAADKNQSQTPVKRSEPTPISLTLAQNNSMECDTVADAVANSDSVLLDSALSRQKSVGNVVSLRKRHGLRSADSKPASISVQHAMTDAATTKTNISYTDVPSTDDNEYVAAVALASLSMATESHLHSTCLSESGTHTETALNHCQTNEEQHKPALGDTGIAVISKPAYDSVPQHLTEQSSCSRSVMKTSFVKPSDQSVKRNVHHTKDGERSGRRVSDNKQREHTRKSVGEFVSERTKSISESQRSRRRRSHSTESAGCQKKVADSKEKLSTKSTVNNDSSLSHDVATRNAKKNTEVAAGTVSRIDSRSNNCAASDKTRHRKHRSGSHRSSEKMVVDRREQKQVAGSNSENCHSSASSRTESEHHVADVNIVESDKPAKGGNVVPVADKCTTPSANISTSTSVLCALSPNHASVLSHSSSVSSSHYMSSSDDTVSCSDKAVSTGEANVSLNSEETRVAAVPSLPSDTPRVALKTGVGTGTSVEQVFSSLNSSTDKRCSETDVVGITSGKADTGVLICVAVRDDDIAPPSRSVARSNDQIVAEAMNSLQQTTCLADYSPKSPTSPYLSPNLPYRESEDIRSPSPMPADPEKADCDEEIRSPSPCDMESPLALFRVVETSWDVKLTSPCEIQSPDISEDEADDAVEEFDRHCNVCLQHGPVTIPLTIEEASKITHNQQPDTT